MQSFRLRFFKGFFFLLRVLRDTCRPSISFIHSLLEWLSRITLHDPKAIQYISVEGIACGETRIESDEIILYIHGGGFAFGSLTTHHNFIAELSEQSGSKVIAVNYSRTPNSIFPVALNECIEVFRALKKQGKYSRVILAGDSAGGNLCVAMTLKLLALGESIPDQLILLCPWTDLSEQGIHRLAKKRDLIFSKHELLKYSAIYCPGDRANPLVSPLYGDFSGFPPALILCDENEILRTNSTELAQRMTACKVNVKLVERKNCFHTWMLFNRLIPEARRDLKLIADHIKAPY